MVSMEWLKMGKADYIQREFDFDLVLITFNKIKPRIAHWQKFCANYFGHAMIDPVWWKCRLTFDDKLHFERGVFAKMWVRFYEQITDRPRLNGKVLWGDKYIETIDEVFYAD